MTNDKLTKDKLSELYGHISPFEFKDNLLKLASVNNSKFNGTILDAGRGNPNWTCATPRQAFFTFGQFAVEETQTVWCEGALAGMPKKEGIASRLRTFLKVNTSLPGVNLIEDIINYGINELNFNEDAWVHELTDGIIGDNYPFPDRILVHIEKIVHNYLIKELFDIDCTNPTTCNNYIKKTYGGNFDVFGVEGGTAAMCYIFDSLSRNELLHKGDKIALMTPIFTPYLEIPNLPNYNFEIINIHASEKDENGNPTWQYPMEELEKLKDTSIKAVFLVNPNNPASVALSEDTRKNITDIVNNHNPNLMIITDDVYCTFVNNFKSLITDLPFNTIGVYSLSKYFGVTGWRLGAIILNENNIFNDLLSKLPKTNKDNLYSRYKHLSQTPEKISFMDRLVADSRHVALNHTAGLSTPQQVQMAFFCGFALVDTNDEYKHLTIEICNRRKQLLFDGLKSELINNPLDASYYYDFNLLDWANSHLGIELVEYIKENYKPLDFLYTLAHDYSIVLLYGSGFNSCEWSLRVSLANLQEKHYYIIGKVLRTILLKLVDDYNTAKKCS